jgi:hypothetical protein
MDWPYDRGGPNVPRWVKSRLASRARTMLLRARRMSSASSSVQSEALLGTVTVSLIKRASITATESLTPILSYGCVFSGIGNWWPARNILT